MPGLTGRIDGIFHPDATIKIPVKPPESAILVYTPLDQLALIFAWAGTVLFGILSATNVYYRLGDAYYMPKFIFAFGNGTPLLACVVLLVICYRKKRRQTEMDASRDVASKTEDP